MPASVNLAVIVKGPAENSAAIEEALRRCMAPSLKEEACKRYIVARDIEVAGRFVLDELWASQEGLEKHFATPHFTHLVSVMEKLGAAIEVSKVKALEPLS